MKTTLRIVTKTVAVGRFAIVFGIPVKIVSQGRAVVPNVPPSWPFGMVTVVVLAAFVGIAAGLCVVAMNGVTQYAHRKLFDLANDGQLSAAVQVNPELGTVCWPSGADLDPDVLYALVTGAPVSV